MSDQTADIVARLHAHARVVMSCGDSAELTLAAAAEIERLRARNATLEQKREQENEELLEEFQEALQAGDLLKNDNASLREEVERLRARGCHWPVTSQCPVCLAESSKVEP